MSETNAPATTPATTSKRTTRRSAQSLGNAIVLRIRSEQNTRDLTQEETSFLRDIVATVSEETGENANTLLMAANLA